MAFVTELTSNLEIQPDTNGGQDRQHPLLVGTEVYLIGVDPAVRNKLRILKASDPSVSFTVLDDANAPVFTTNAVVDTTGWLLDADGITIHVIHRNADTYYYHKFDTVTDTWQNVDGASKSQTIKVINGDPFPSSMDLTQRSTGEIVFLYSGDFTVNMGGQVHSAEYARLSGGVWTTGITVTDWTDKLDRLYACRVFVGSANDQAIFAITRNDSGITQGIVIRGLSPTNVLRTSHFIPRADLSPSEVFHSGNIYTVGAQEIIQLVTGRANINIVQGAVHFDYFTDDSTPTFTITADINGDSSVTMVEADQRSYDTAYGDKFYHLSLVQTNPGSVRRWEILSTEGTPSSWSVVKAVTYPIDQQSSGLYSPVTGTVFVRGGNIVYAYTYVLSGEWYAEEIIASAGPTTHTASGTPTLNAVTVAGTATDTATRTASGTPSISAVTASGVAERVLPASGTVTTTAATVAGTATRLVERTATGAVTLGAATASGTATRILTSTSAIALNAASAAGVAERILTASGTVTLAAVTAAGEASGLVELTASGAVTTSAVTASGAATRVLTASGGVSINPIEVGGPAFPVLSAATETLGTFGDTQNIGNVTLGAGRNVIFVQGFSTIDRSHDLFTVGGVEATLITKVFHVTTVQWAYEIIVPSAGDYEVILSYGPEGALGVCHVGCYHLGNSTINGAPITSTAGGESPTVFEWDIDVSPTEGFIAAIASGSSSGTWSSPVGWDQIDDQAVHTRAYSVVSLANSVGGSPLSTSISFSAAFVTVGAVGLRINTAQATAERVLTADGAVTLSGVTVAGTATRAGAITADGAVTTAAITVSGEAERVLTADGAITTGAATVAGAAERTLTADGAVTATGTIVSGAAERSLIANGTVTTTATTVAGAAERILTADGAIITAATTVAGDAEIAGALSVTGDVSINGVTVTGSAERILTATGAINLGGVTVAGDAERSLTADGAVTTGVATVSGEAERSLTASGSVSVSAITVSGSAERILTSISAVTLNGLQVAGTAELVGAIGASGNISLNPVTISATAERILTASGTVITAATQVASTSIVLGTVSADGAFTVPAALASGDATRASVATGAISLGAATVSGSATANANLTASGSVQLGPATVEGVANRTYEATGAITINATEVIGIAGNSVLNVASGNITTTPATVTGASTRVVTATGTITLTAANVSGSASRGSVASGDATTSAATASGAATRIVTASGNVSVSGITVSASAFRTGFASGAITLNPVGVSGIALNIPFNALTRREASEFESETLVLLESNKNDVLLDSHGENLFLLDLTENAA